MAWLTTLWNGLGHIGKIRTLVWIGGLIVAVILALWGWLTTIPGPLAILMGIWALVGILLIANNVGRLRAIALPRFFQAVQIDFHSKRQIATAAELEDTLIRERLVDINRVPRQDSTIKGKTFESCDIVGPAMICLINHALVTECGFDSMSADYLLWEIPPEKTLAVGLLVVDGCTFLRCRFQNIGIAAPKAQIDEFKKNIGFG